MKTLSVRLTPALYALVTAIADERCITQSAALREIVIDHFNSADTTNKLDAIQSKLDSLAEKIDALEVAEAD